MTLRGCARVLLPAYLAALYATLGVARELTEFVRSAGLLRLVVGVAFALAAASVAALLARDKRNRSPRVLLAACGVAALYAACVYPLSSPEEKLHFIQYGVVALLAWAAAPERWTGVRRAAAAALFTALAGWGDEGIQAVLPNRYYDLRDVGFNALAGVLALAALETLRFVRGPPASKAAAATNT